MRKLWIVLIILLLVGSFAAPAAAAPNNLSRKPIVAILPVINNASQKNTKFMIQMVDDSLSRKFSGDRYLVISGQMLMDAFRRRGVDDPSSLDQETLNAVLRDMQIDYSVRTEILPVNARQRVDFPDIFLFMKTWVATVPFSWTITNVQTGEILYDFTYADSGKHEAIIGFANRDYAISVALSKVLERFESEPINLN